jgi:hypothetical protein
MTAWPNHRQATRRNDQNVTERSFEDGQIVRSIRLTPE